MQLIPITTTGEPAESIDGPPKITAQVGAAYRQLYDASTYAPPWIGYFALENGVCVGTCGFKGPPLNNRVEIAYFTFPEHEGHGCATRMAGALLRIVREADAGLIARAQTLPLIGASTTILKKFGFLLLGTLVHPDDGEVWEWQITRCHNPDE